MAKKMVFRKEDNLFYVATYTNEGDFSSVSEKGYETLGLANASAGIPEGTPSGETVSDETEVQPAVAETATPETLSSAEYQSTTEVSTQATGNIDDHLTGNELVGTPILVKVETENTGEVVPVATDTLASISEDGKTATFEDGSTAPIVSREEVVVQLGEETVAKMEAEAVAGSVSTDTVENAPVAELEVPATLSEEVVAPAEPTTSAEVTV